MRVRLNNDFMKKDSSQSGWWGKGAAVTVVLLFGGLAAAPYLVAATKGFASDGKVSVEKVVNDARGEAEKFRESEIKAAAWSADGKLYVGTKKGLAVLKDGRSEPVADAPRDEVKAVACDAEGGVWVAGKKGLHLLKDGRWSVEKQGDFFSVSVNRGGVIAVAKRGIYSRGASGGWTEVKAPAAEMKEAEKEDGEHEKMVRSGKDRPDKGRPDKQRGEKERGEH